MPLDWLTIAAAILALGLLARLFLRGRAGWLGCVIPGTLAGMITSMVVVAVGLMAHPAPGGEAVPIWRILFLGAVPLAIAVAASALVSPPTLRRKGAAISATIVAAGCGWFYAVILLIFVVSAAAAWWSSIRP